MVAAATVRRALRLMPIGITTIINNLTISPSTIPQASNQTKITKRCVKNLKRKPKSLSKRQANGQNTSNVKVKKRAKNGNSGRKSRIRNKMVARMDHGAALNKASKISPTKSHLPGKR